MNGNVSEATATPSAEDKVRSMAALLAMLGGDDQDARRHVSQMTREGMSHLTNSLRRIESVTLALIQDYDTYARNLAAWPHYPAETRSHVLTRDQCGDCTCCGRDQCTTRQCAGAGCPCTEGLGG